ncbi:MAG: hypothetical protein ACRDN0_16965, partial [Trebonia sp.]
MWAEREAGTPQKARELVLEDEEQRMIVYSSHTTRTPMDEVRRDSILRRETQQPVRDWFRDFGITVSAGPIRIPRAERLGILGRLCVPIRSRGLLTGFLWLIDDRGALSAEQVGIAEHAATQAGLLMLEDALAEKRGTGALRQLLSASDELRTAAARQVRDEGLLPGTAPAAIAVVQVVGEGGAGAAGDGTDAVDGGDAGTRLTISEALADVTRRHESGALLGLAFRDHLAMLLRVNGGAGRADRAREIGCETREAMARRLTRGGSRARVVVGIGDPCGLLEESFHSYRQARLAASTAAEIPSFGKVARWRDLGVYRAISQLPGPEAAD